jgi:hypothetical protein
MQIRVARDEVVTAKMVDHPHGEEPAEAAEVVQQVPDWQLRRFGS